MVINREKSQSKHSNHVIEKSATAGIVVACILRYIIERRIELNESFFHQSINFNVT
jgi:hypothetical protein